MDSARLGDPGQACGQERHIDEDHLPMMTFDMKRPSWHRPRRMLAAAMLGLTALVVGCASTTPAQITTFNRQDSGADAWAGRRFIVQPLPGQAESLEYADYSLRVREALRRQGLVPVSDLHTAELVVRFEYRADGGNVTGRTSSSSVSLGLGGGYRTGWGVGLGVPIGGTSENIQYRHRLQVQIDRVRAASGGPAPGGPIPGERVYESTLVTRSESAAVAPQMPAMIDALFDDFPGVNGKTVTVNLPAE